MFHEWIIACTPQLHSFKKTCKTTRYNSDKEESGQKVQKKKQGTSLNKNVTDAHIDLQRIWWVKKVWAFQICNVVCHIRKK